MVIICYNYNGYSEHQSPKVPKKSSKWLDGRGTWKAGRQALATSFGSKSFQGRPRKGQKKSGAYQIW